VSDESLNPGSTATLDDVSSAIDRAGYSLGWKIRDVIPGRSIGVFHKRKHIAQVLIEYDIQSFSVTYMRSANLDERDGEIHGAYNRWVSELTERIALEVAAIP